MLSVAECSIESRIRSGCGFLVPGMESRPVDLLFFPGGAIFAGKKPAYWR